ncbi:MAG TPA: carboxypeptidase-like regulatory domain-containing protein, partial [Pyrinomonadaceae bacterium]|nr:carboxypeptidase-like regulatory domain-containing protein [Pyrinomonadaceae bacterium]
MTHLKSFLYIGIFTIFFSSQIFAQQTGSLGGQVLDSTGAVIVGATVTSVDASGKVKTAITNQRGEFSVMGLAPGTYTVRAIAPQFGLYENTEVQIQAGAREELVIALSIAAVTEEVQVSTENQVSTDPDSNASATVLKEKDLEALPDDPDELEAALQALAGPSAGP